MERGIKKELLEMREDGETCDSIRTTTMDNKEKDKADMNSLQGRQHLSLEGRKDSEDDIGGNRTTESQLKV